MFVFLKVRLRGSGSGEWKVGHRESSPTRVTMKDGGKYNGEVSKRRSISDVIGENSDIHAERVRGHLDFEYTYFSKCRILKRQRSSPPQLSVHSKTAKTYIGSISARIATPDRKDGLLDVSYPGTMRHVPSSLG